MTDSQADPPTPSNGDAPPEEGHAGPARDAGRGPLSCLVLALMLLGVIGAIGVGTGLLLLRSLGPHARLIRQEVSPVLRDFVEGLSQTGAESAYLMMTPDCREAWSRERLDELAEALRSQPGEPQWSPDMEKLVASVRGREVEDIESVPVECLVRQGELVAVYDLRIAKTGPERWRIDAFEVRWITPPAGGPPGGSGAEGEPP